MNKYKVSIIVPIYNVEKYLKNCLESLVNQTIFPDIEVICIEDCSTDKTKEILLCYENKYDNFKVIYHKKNEGTSKTRKNGVFEATGQYIMFLDADDYYNLDACEKAYNAIERSKVDVLQFMTNVLPGKSTSKEMLDWIENFLTPLNDRQEDINLLTECFTKRSIDGNLWDKIWRTEICKKAFGYIKDYHYITAEDQYAVFIMFYFSKTYDSILERLYNYRLEVGIMGGEILDLERFEKRCSGQKVLIGVQEFLNEVDKQEEYKDEFENFSNNLLWDSIDCWYNKLEKKNYRSGFDILKKYWPIEDIVGAYTRMHFENQLELDIRIHEKTNILLYYRYVGYENMDFIIKNYIDFYKLNNNNLILVTDKKADDNLKEYMNNPLCYIQAVNESNWDKYKVRAQDWVEIIKKYNIDQVLYLSPTSHITHLDKIMIEESNVRFVMVFDEIGLSKINELTLELDQMKEMSTSQKKALNSKSIRIKKFIKKCLNR